MKKILLATTILGMTAGFAAADVAVSGSAKAGMASYEGGDYNTYSSFKLVVTGSGTTDGGISFGASMDATGGDTYDSLGDFDADSVIKSKDGHFGMPTVFVSGGFGKLSFSADNFDFYDDSHGKGDVKYEYTAGDVTVGVISDVDHEDGSQYSAKLSATISGIALSVDTDSYDVWNASAAYTTGPVTLTLSADESDTQKLKVAYAADAIRASVKVGSDDSWEATAGYTVDGIALDVLADDSEYQELTVSTDLGGGAKVVGGVNTTENAFAGVELSF